MKRKKGTGRLQAAPLPHPHTSPFLSDTLGGGVSSEIGQCICGTQDNGFKTPVSLRSMGWVEAWEALKGHPVPRVVVGGNRGCWGNLSKPELKNHVGASHAFL